MRSILADGLCEHMIIKAFGDFSGSLFLVSDVEKALTDSILILKNHLKVFLDISFTV